MFMIWFNAYDRYNNFFQEMKVIATNGLSSTIWIYNTKIATTVDCFYHKWYNVFLAIKSNNQLCRLKKRRKKIFVFSLNCLSNLVEAENIFLVINIKRNQLVHRLKILIFLWMQVINFLTKTVLFAFLLLYIYAIFNVYNMHDILKCMVK